MSCSKDAMYSSAEPKMSLKQKQSLQERNPWPSRKGKNDSENEHMRNKIEQFSRFMFVGNNGNTYFATSDVFIYVNPIQSQLAKSSWTSVSSLCLPTGITFHNISLKKSPPAIYEEKYTHCTNICYS